MESEGVASDAPAIVVGSQRDTQIGKLYHGPQTSLASTQISMGGGESMEGGGEWGLEILKMKANNIRVICVDMDGTFLNDAHRVDDENCRAFAEAVESGYICLIATGRLRVSALKQFTPQQRSRMHLSDEAPGIFMNGSTVYGLGGEVLRQSKFSDEDRTALIDVLIDLNCIHRCLFAANGYQYTLKFTNATLVPHVLYEDVKPIQLETPEPIKSLIERLHQSEWLEFGSAHPALSSSATEISARHTSSLANESTSCCGYLGATSSSPPAPNSMKDIRSEIHAFLRQEVPTLFSCAMMGWTTEQTASDTERLNQYSAPVLQRVTIAQSIPYMLDIAPGGISKADGIRVFVENISRQLNEHITMENVASVGDNFNDISMIKESGIGFAVGNARQGVKDAADIVLDRNNNDNAFAYLYNLISKYKTSS